MSPSANGYIEKEPRVIDFTAGFPQPPSFKDKREEREYLKGRLAAGFRILGERGLNEGVAGHITLRDPIEPDTFWVNPFGISFNLIKRSDLVRVDEEGRVLEGGEWRLINRAAIMIHTAVHKARPDVMCAAHSHTVYGKAFAAVGKPLKIISQDACAFYKDCALYDNFEGIVLEEKEGQNIAAAMGDKKAVILKNHGLLTASPSVEATLHWFVALESACQVQLLTAAAVGGDDNIVEVGEQEAAQTYKSTGSPNAGWFQAKPMFDEMLHKTNGNYLA